MTTLSPVELGVLGPLQVRQHGLPVAVPGAKPRAVLTMLGLNGGSVVSADTLAELLWGARPPRTAVKALQTHISSLRRALGDGFVLTEGSGWTLNTTDIDATRYKLAARVGRDAIASGDAAQAVARFDEALALWRGIPELPDGPRAVSEKTRWIEGHAALVEDRADALLATGRAAEIVGELEAAIADAPLRERRWGQLMLALYRAGRQGEALAAYQRARTLLVDELGVDPGPNLRRLEAAIVAQDGALEIPVPQQLSTVTKAVTFLLTDIEGSTAAWEAQADAMAVALARHDEIVEQVVTSRGGRLVKTRGEGDATFSVFDRPSAAAAAAIELQEAIRHEPWALANPMRIRVSLHTGEVELRDGDYFGRAVNRAARLRSLAAGGQILCSGATAELVIDTLADDVVLADLGMRQLKNLARPEHVFELRLEAADDVDDAEPDPPMPRPSLPAVLTGPGPFVGRGEELAGLLTAWQSTLSVGTRAVLVAGEPGVGKTRLAGEWSRQVYEEGAVVLYGRCDEDLGAAYQPFAEALRSLVPCLGADRLRGLRGVEALLPLVPGLTDVAPDLPTPSRSDPDTERYALFDAVVALLGAASTSAPIVLILDDLHWAAKPTLLLLRHLLRFGEHARVQIVGTYRSTDLDRSHPLAAMLTDLHRDGSAVRLALTGLDEKDVSAYVSEAGYNDEELARALASVTGGNPFFLIEALRHVDESGGRWDPNTLPQGVREAVSRRLSRLPAETNKALAAAAVVGSRFAVELVERVVDGDLVDAFDEACKAGIVIEEPGGRYRFNHALVRQSLLAELPSVRRMRLHQRIAVTLEAESGAEEELLAELAYHYFECAWAGNAAKAVEYCRRAADQAMARLAYEGAADLYDRALHALEELDDELPDRDALQAELLVARCEALLAAGDVGSAVGAVAQLQQAAGDSVRLSAWGACFDGELSMLTNPDRLDEIEAAVGAAAEKLAGLEDAAGEAKAHTVRAACLARLGRIGDAETALDQALTAARRAHDHRRVNAVLAGAPLAALWGPNPVPRAGGRCLDVVRLLRITTGSPVVEATSTRCQGVLDALRGRASAGRALIDSARRSLTELGMRHALLEVEQFAGLVELVANEPAAAEPLLRRACDGFRRMGLDADTAETAAFLARACLALERDAEADELCVESERLAGHALKPSITWRTVRAQLLARRGAHDEARRVAEEAVSIAERTDALVDHGDACLTLAMVLNAAGDIAGARAAAESAIALFERKGAAALAELARGIVGSATPTAFSTPDQPAVEPENECVRTLRRVEEAVSRGLWSDVEQAHAPIGSIESRRKIVGFERMDLPASRMASGAEKFIRDMRAVRTSRPILAIRGERLALTRTVVGTADDSPGAPLDEMLQLVGLDDEGRIAVQVWFDVEDVDAALAELDAQHAGSQLDNACVQVLRRIDDAVHRSAWDEAAQEYAPLGSIESRRKIVGFARVEYQPSEFASEARNLAIGIGARRIRRSILAVRNGRLALSAIKVGTADLSPGAPQDEWLQLVGLDEEGRIALQIWFDVEDMDAAIAELDAQHAGSQLDTACVRLIRQLDATYDRDAWKELAQSIAPVVSVESRRKIVGVLRVDNSQSEWLDAAKDYRQIVAQVRYRHTVVAARGERLALTSLEVGTKDQTPGAPRDALLQLYGLDEAGRLALHIHFDIDDVDAALAELDAQYARLQLDNACVHVIRRLDDALQRDSWDEVEKLFAADISAEDRRKIVGFPRVVMSSGEWLRGVKRIRELGAWRLRREEIAVRGDRLALSRFEVSGADTSPGATREILLHLFGLDDEDRISLHYAFTLEHIDAAIAELDAQYMRLENELASASAVENACVRALRQMAAAVDRKSWGEVGRLFAPTTSVESRRKLVGFGLIDLPAHKWPREIRRYLEDMAPQDHAVVATRGDRLALVRLDMRAEDTSAGAPQDSVLELVSLDAAGLIDLQVWFDTDDVDAAIAELDARYLAGEAASHAQVWRSAMATLEEVNRHVPGPILSRLTYADHRRVSFGSADFGRAVEELWALVPDARYRASAVHALDRHGTVATLVIEGTDSSGNELQWSRIVVLLPDEQRMEVYEDDDLNAALTRFDELSRAPRLENAASRMYERLQGYFEAQDWDALAETMSADIHRVDRRRVVNAEESRGREAAVAEAQIMAGFGAKSVLLSVVATRGHRLALIRSRFSGEDKRTDAYYAELLCVVQIDLDGLVTEHMMFDLDDLDAAFQELDARYLAGEAAEHAHTWSVVAGVFTALNRHEIPAATLDWVNIDHRRGTPLAHSDLKEIVESLNELTPDLSNHVEAVHLLRDQAALVTQVSRGTSREGFDAEWRIVNLLTVDGDKISRCELFDEADLATAIARFDQLSRPVQRLDNAASRILDGYLSHFPDRDWDFMSRTLAANFEGEDRRHIVSQSPSRGRDEEIANLKVIAELGCSNITSTPIATRGERLVLAHHLLSTPGELFEFELVDVIEIDGNNQIVKAVSYNVDQLDAALADLDARYAGGEGADHSDTWSVITKAYSFMNQRGLPATTAGWVNIDHRRGATFAPGDMSAYIQAAWDDLTQDLRIYVEAVHRLSDFGTVLTQVLRGTTREGFDAEWRTINLFSVEGEKFNRCELFDESDLDAALTRFDELSRPAPRLENAASQAWSRLRTHFSSGDWHAMSEVLAQNMIDDDRRRTVNGGTRRGKDIQIANGQAVAETGADKMTSSVIAIRGEHLALCRSSFFVEDQKPEAFRIDFLSVVEVDADGKVVGHVAFDTDDVDAACAELEARYLASESASHTHTWSVIIQSLAAFNRGSRSTTTRDWVTIDHRRVARFAPGELAAAVSSAGDQTPEFRAHNAAVHRLSGYGAVVTTVSHGTSPQGFEAEWKVIQILAVDGELISRCELFDETDLDAALARFDELSPPAPRLENAASQVYARFSSFYASADLDGLATTMAADFAADDRRRFVGSAGTQLDRQAAFENARVTGDLGVRNAASTVIAIRGQHLVLVRARFWGRDELPDAFNTEVLHLVEIDARQQITGFVAFDLDERDSAFTELDARYIAGEAAPHADTLSVVLRNYAAVSRHELPGWTPDAVKIDHRRTIAVAPGGLPPYLNAMWAQTPDVQIYIENVHRLTGLGVVVTHVATGTAQQGFEGEWREVTLSMVEGGMISRSEMFDESDLDAALAKLDELSQPAGRLTNTASVVEARCQAHIAAGNWDAMATVMADDISIDDRRRVVNAGLRRGRDAVIDDLRVGAEIGLTQITPTAMATRGERLTLGHIRYWGGDQRAETGLIELVQLVEIDADQRIIALVLFDPDDLEAAFTELDTRYLGNEAAAHSHTYSVIADAFAAVNRHELPSTTTDFVSIDHRRPIAFAPGEMMAYLQATLNDSPEIRIDIESVHRLSSRGAVVSHAWHNTSQQGFDAEWRVIGISTVDGDLVNRCELFDESDLDAALSRFDELSRPSQLPANSASRASERLWTSFASHDWDAVADVLAEGIVTYDRRHVVNAGTRRGRDIQIGDLHAAVDVGAENVTAKVMGTRGDRLALLRLRFSNVRMEFAGDVLAIAEVDGDGRIVSHINFDVDDLDSAFAELDARYIAGEAGANAQTWSVVAGVFRTHNQGVLPATTSDVASVDHRKVAAFAPGEGVDYIRAGWDTLQDINVYIETVHALTDLGAVFTWSGTGTSRDGFTAEWRGINLVMVDGELVSRSEVFDDDDIDAALARFEGVSRSETRLENAASRVCERYRASFAARDWDAAAGILAGDLHNEDRRRVVNAGVRRGRDSALEDLRAAADLGVPYFTADLIANRGEHLALFRGAAAYDERPGAFHVDVLQLAEIDADGRIAALITFDLDDIDAAFEELDARYLSGEAADHARTWSAITSAYAGMTRGEVPATTSDLVNVDHRRVAPMAPDDGIAYLHASWDLATEFNLYIESVHRLSDLGAVFTRASNATSREGFDAEWRAVDVITVEGNLISRGEIFDESDIDVALARFDELSLPAPRLENAASLMGARFQECFGVGDWDGLATIFADDICLHDRRPLVGASLVGRDATMANMQVSAETGVRNVTTTVVATRGSRLALQRVHIAGRDQRPEAFRTDGLLITEIDDQNRVTAFVLFNPDEFDAAFAELEARYIAGEAAPFSPTWSVIAAANTRVNRGQLFPTTPDWVNIDHRSGTPFPPSDMASYVAASLEQTPALNAHIESVHRLSHLGAVVTSIAQGATRDGFDAEWRTVTVAMVDGQLCSRCEVYDETDLDAALAQFDELTRSTPAPIETTASRMLERYVACYRERDWDGMAELLAEDVVNDDRRRVVNSGTRIGRDTFIADSRAAIDVGSDGISSRVIATRGQRLILAHVSTTNRGFDEIAAEMIGVGEIDSENQIVANVIFDVDDIDAAFAELDARYIAGEAADHARAWSAVAETHSGYNRSGLVPNDDWVSIDHRRGYPADKLTTTIRGARDLTPDLSIYIEAVHRLSDRAAVITNKSFGTSQDGFAAEWRMIQLMTVDGDQVTHLEIFDESDIDVALAKFAELARPTQHLTNMAYQVIKRVRMLFAVRDWSGMRENLAESFLLEDRRRTVNGGISHGRDTTILDLQAAVEVGFTDSAEDAVALRGERLVLTRARYAVNDSRPESYFAEVLHILEIDAEQKLVATIVFDPEDTDAAFAELDARYATGEATACARTWSVISRAYAALDRHEIPPTTQDWVNVDRRHATAFDDGGFFAFVRAAWDVAPNMRRAIETVHRLSNLGAVITHTAHGSSQAGFEAEWRSVVVVTVDGELINHLELFDEGNLDGAIARFDELSQPASRLQNAASRLYDQFNSHFAAREWDAIADMLTEDHCSDDRRPVVGAGIRHGREAEIQDLQGVAAEFTNMTMSSVVVATRGERVALCRGYFSGHDQQSDALQWDLLGIIEMDANERIAAFITFDPNDIDAAFAELDSRYLAGDAAGFAHTWSVVSAGFAALNRREVPARTPGWAMVDHRKVTTFAPGDLSADLQAMWELAPHSSWHIEAVHRLNGFGAVVTYAGNATTEDGFVAEWRAIDLMGVDGDMLSHTELFDESDLSAALARFEDLGHRAPRLENAATHINERFDAHFAVREWDAMAEMLADDFTNDDRRNVVNAGIQQGRTAEIASLRACATLGVATAWSVAIAIRGERLALSRTRFSPRAPRPGAFQVELLDIVEIDADGLITARVAFDADDVDAATAELDARYLAGEAAAHSHVWSVIASTYAALNRGELSPTTKDQVHIDHRTVITIEPNDLAETVRFAWDLVPDPSMYVEAVHHLSGFGAVVTNRSYGTSKEGFDAEWRMVQLMTVEGGRINRLELFDEADIGAAMAGLDKLRPPVPRLENTATRNWVRLADAFHRRDEDAFVDLTRPDGELDDRRRGLRVSLDGSMRRRAVQTLFEFPQSWRMELEHLAVRGSGLSLSRQFYRDQGQTDRPITVEVLTVTECSDDDYVHALVLFDPDDVDAAMAELDTRYIAGEGADFSHIWTLVNQTYARFNLHELSPTTPDWVNIDHRRGAVPESGEMHAYVSAMWTVAPDVRTCIESVHRLTNLGAVFTHTELGTSQQGFAAEWREITLLTFDGNLIDRCELFDEDALDIALARFDELIAQANHCEAAATQLNNAATRVRIRVADEFNRRDMSAFLAFTAPDGSFEDHRKGLRDAATGTEIAKVTKALFETVPADWLFEVKPLALRGSRLALTRDRYRTTDDDPTTTAEHLTLTEINDDQLVSKTIIFDPDDVDAAIAELDARYLAGEAAVYSEKWSDMVRVCGEFNRREIPSATANFVNVDHRRGTAFAPGELTEYLLAMWDLSPTAALYIEEAHQLTYLGAVVTLAAHATSREGFAAEWRVIILMTFEEHLLTRVEIFDESDVAVALATLDELSPPAAALQNAATRASAALADAFNRQDRNGLVAVYDTNAPYDDRRKGLRNIGPLNRDFGAGLFEFEATAGWRLDADPIGIRGEYLGLIRHSYRDTAESGRPITVEALVLIDADAGGLIRNCVLFDPDDIDAAFAELTARWIASGDVAHPDVIEAALRSNEVYNRHDWDAMVDNESGATYVNHRQLASAEPETIADHWRSIRALAALIPDMWTEPTEILAHSAIGLVASLVVKGRTPEGAAIEFPAITLILFEHGRVARLEAFDVDQRDLALARFQEFNG